MTVELSEKAQHAIRYSDIGSLPERMLPPIKGLEKTPLVSLEEAVKPLISLVPDVEKMVSRVKQNIDQPKDGLSCDTSGAIMLYSMEWTPREQSFYVILNATLRAESRQELRPWFLYLRLVIIALSTLPSVEGRTIYRGVNMDLSAEYPKGKEIVWWGFSSCSSSVNVLKNFLGESGTRTIFNIESNTGKDIRQHSCFPTEDEVLLLPARQFKVVSSLKLGEGDHIIQLKEIHPKPPLLPVNTSSTILTHKNLSLLSIFMVFIAVLLIKHYVVNREPSPVINDADLQLIDKFLTDYHKDISLLFTHAQNIEHTLEPKLKIFFKQLGCNSDTDNRNRINDLVLKYIKVLTSWRTHYQNIFSGLRPLLIDSVLSIRNAYKTRNS